MKGLLVDDDELYARTLQRSLARKGIETEIALDAASALARAREYLPDFALVDLKLGSDSGLTLIEPLRAKQRRIAAETKQIAQDLEAVQLRLPGLVQNAARDPDAPNRTRLTALREQLAQLNARIGQEQRRFTPPERMRDVLQEMLRRNKGLTLVDLKTLPVAPVGAAPAGACGRLQCRVAFGIGSPARLRSRPRRLRMRV